MVSQAAPVPVANKPAATSKMDELLTRAFTVTDKATGKEVVYEVRAVMRDGEIWFVAKDVCDALDMDTTNGTGQWTRGISADKKGMSEVHTLGGVQKLAVISESGLYSLIQGSRKPNAQPFKDWVTGEVLPSIRKTGGYGEGQGARAGPVRSPQSPRPWFAARTHLCA